MLKAKDVMVKDVVAVPPSTPIIEVAQRMSKSGTRVACIFLNGKFQGLITERAIIADIVARARNPKREHARSLVDSHYTTISPGTELPEAIKVMMNSDAQVLPVVQDGSLLGLLTLGDLIRESPAMTASVLLNNSLRRLSMAQIASEGASTGRASAGIVVSKGEVAWHEH